MIIVSVERVEKVLKDGKWHSIKEITRRLNNKRSDLAALIRMFSRRKDILRKYDNGEAYYRMI